MSSSKGVAYAVGGLVAAEAVGITNFSGGGNGGTNIELPGQGGSGLSDLPLSDMFDAMSSGDGGLAPEEIMALMGLQGGNVPAVRDITGDLTQEGQDLQEWFESNMQRAQNANRAVEPTAVPDSLEGQNFGKKLGDNTAGLIWGMAEGPATALDENSWLEGNLSDNVDDVTDHTTDPIGDFARSKAGQAADQLGPNGGSPILDQLGPNGDNFLPEVDTSNLGDKITANDGGYIDRNTGDTGVGSKIRKKAQNVELPDVGDDLKKLEGLLGK